jgi:hypothetical protein
VGGLPLPVVLGCKALLVPRVPDVRFIITTSRTAHAAALAEGVPVFTGSELEAIAIAVQCDRMFAIQFVEILKRKSDPVGAMWRVTLDHALGGLPRHNVEPLRITVGDLLSRIGATLESVDVDA